VQLEVLDQLKKSTPSGLGPATFRLVASASNNYATPCPRLRRAQEDPEDTDSVCEDVADTPVPQQPQQAPAVCPCGRDKACLRSLQGQEFCD
jgi:hypothetical protein